MSLRAFHVAFIVVSITLSLVVAAWGVREFVVAGRGEALAVGAAAVVAGTALVLYGRRFFSKLQELA
jgi:hypothetical protein